MTGGQSHLSRAPVELGQAGRWVLYGIIAYLALRLLMALVRGPSRR